MQYAVFEFRRLEAGIFPGGRQRFGKWFSQVSLQNASFFKTPLKGMDFTTCDIKGLVLSDECSEVRGAVMDLYQAAELAKRLGIVIK